MADTDFDTDYPDAAVLADDSKFLAKTAAGGGVNYPGSAFMKRDAAGVVFDGFGASSTAGTLDWNDASNARSGGGAAALAGTASNGPAAAGGALFHPFGFRLGAAGALTQIAVPYGHSNSITAGFGFRGNFSGTWGSWRQMLCENAFNSFAPWSDNAKSLGSASLRFSVVYAATGSINTSDSRDKQQIAAISDAWLDAWADVEWVQFKFNDSVTEKGADNARWHTGLVAQQIRDAFANHGFDAVEIGLIGLLCHDEWEGAPAQPQVVDEDGNEVTPAQPAGVGGDRYGLRYEECFAVEAAYQRRRMAAIEARLAALEGAQ